MGVVRLGVALVVAALRAGVAAAVVATDVVAVVVVVVAVAVRVPVVVAAAVVVVDGLSLGGHGDDGLVALGLHGRQRLLDGLLADLGVVTLLVVGVPKKDLKKKKKTFKGVLQVLVYNRLSMSPLVPVSGPRLPSSCAPLDPRRS